MRCTLAEELLLERWVVTLEPLLDERCALAEELLLERWVVALEPLLEERCALALLEEVRCTLALVALLERCALPVAALLERCAPSERVAAVVRLP